MSESTTETTESAPASDFEPITSQEEFDKRLEARLAREAKKYADYSDLKAKAAKLDQLEAETAEANKSWEERYKSLESTVAKKDLEILRVQVAAAKGVPANRINGTTREELEADADELLTLISKQEEAKKPKLPSSGLKSGATGSDSRLDPKERAAAALRSFRRT